MKNEVVQDIIDYARKKLTEKYGYCGVAVGDSNAFLNSDDKKGNDIKIKIDVIPEPKIIT